MTENNNNRILETFRDGSSLLLECNVKRIDFKRGDKVLVTDPVYWFEGTEHQIPSQIEPNSGLDFWAKYRQVLFGNGHNGDGRYGLFTYTFSPASRQRAVANVTSDALAATKLAAGAIGRANVAYNSLFPFTGSSSSAMVRIPSFCKFNAQGTIEDAVKQVDAMLQAATNAIGVTTTTTSSSASNNNNVVQRKIKFLTASTLADGDFKVTADSAGVTANGAGRRRNAKMRLLSGNIAGVDTGTLAIALLDDVLQIQPNALNGKGKFRSDNGNDTLGVIFEVVAPKASVYIDSRGNITGALQCLIFDDEEEDEEKDEEEEGEGDEVMEKEEENKNPLKKLKVQ